MQYNLHKMRPCCCCFSYGEPLAGVNLRFIWTNIIIMDSVVSSAFSSKQMKRIDNVTVMYQSIPKPPIPTPGQSPGISLALSSLQRGIWPKMRPAWWGIWLSCLSAVGSKRISQFFGSAHDRRSPVIALVDSTWVFLLLSFYIVILWNMPLFKVWSEDKLNKKIICSGWKFCRTCFHSCFSIPGGWGIWPSLKL